MAHCMAHENSQKRSLTAVSSSRVLEGFHYLHKACLCNQTLVRPAHEAEGIKRADVKQ